MREVWFIIIILIIVFAGTKWFFEGFVPTINPPTQYGQPVTSSPFPSEKTLQVDSLNIATLTPPPPTIDAASCDVPPAIERDLPALTDTIKHDFGILLGGDALSIDKARLTYETMCLAFKSSMYQKNLNSLQNPILVNFLNKGSCFSYSYQSPAHMELWEPCSALADQYNLIHELTHHMQFGQALGRDAHWAMWQIVWNNEKSHRIPTGHCYYQDSGNGAECEADAVAEYMFYKVYRDVWKAGPPGGPTLPDYQTTWPKWYNFVKTEIFGGIEY